MDSKNGADVQGVFVRHSYTSAGYVRQVIVPEGGETNGRRGKLEKHKVIPHGRKGAHGKYVGVLEAESSKGRDAQGREEQRLLANATKTNTIVKYLGYAAEVCNDYPRQMKRITHVNTVLVRNFAKATASKNKKPSKPQLGGRMRRTSKVGPVENPSDAAGIQQDLADPGIRLNQLQRKHRILELGAALEGLQRSQESICALQAPSSKTAGQLVECSKHILAIEQQRLIALHPDSPPSVSAILVKRCKAGLPVAKYLLDMIKLAHDHASAGDHTQALSSAKAVLKVVDKLSVAAAGTECPRPPRNSEDCLTGPRLQALEVRQVFQHAASGLGSEHRVSVQRLAETFVEQWSLDVSALGRLGRALQDGFDTAEGNPAEPLVQFLREAVRDSMHVESVSWEELATILRYEETYLDSIARLEEEFSPAERVSLRDLFRRACSTTGNNSSTVEADDTDNDNDDDDESDPRGSETSPEFAGTCLEAVDRLAPGQALVQGLEADAMLRSQVIDWGALESTLGNSLDRWTFEEFLCLAARHFREPSLKEVRFSALEAVGAAYLAQACRARKPDRIGETSLAEAHSVVEHVLNERLESVNFDEHHASLLETYRRVSQLRFLQSLVEEHKLEKRICDTVDRFLCSRSGKAAVSDIVAKMADQDVGRVNRNTKQGRVPVLSVEHRASAELAARDMLRSKKAASLRRSDLVAVFQEKRRGAFVVASRTRDIVDRSWGPCSLEAVQCAVVVARMHRLSWTDGAANRARRCTELVEEAVQHLDSLRSRKGVAAHEQRVEEALAAQTVQLAKLHESQGHHKGAGLRFQQAAEIRQDQRPQAALLLWRKALESFGKDTEALHHQIECSTQVIACLRASGSAPTSVELDQLVEEHVRHGELLVKAGDTQSAKAAFGRAQGLLQAASATPTPKQRRKLQHIARLSSSAATSSKLRAIIGSPTSAQSPSSGQTKVEDLLAAAWLRDD